MTARFVIVGAPRTGSTLLVRTLNGISGVRCHGELLQRNVVRGLEDGFDPEQATADERKARAQRLYDEREAGPVEFIEKALSGDNLALERFVDHRPQADKDFMSLCDSSRLDGIWLDSARPV